MFFKYAKVLPRGFCAVSEGKKSLFSLARLVDMYSRWFTAWKFIRLVWWCASEQTTSSRLQQKWVLIQSSHLFNFLHSCMKDEPVVVGLVKEAFSHWLKAEEQTASCQSGSRQKLDAGSFTQPFPQNFCRTGRFFEECLYIKNETGFIFGWTVGLSAETRLRDCVCAPLL